MPRISFVAACCRSLSILYILCLQKIPLSMPISMATVLVHIDNSTYKSLHKQEMKFEKIILVVLIECVVC